jgi:hypothetical protein
VRCILVSITYHWRYVPVYPDDAAHAQHHLVWGIKQKGQGCSKLRVLHAVYESTSSSTMLFILANDRGSLRRAVRLFPICTVYKSLRFAPSMFIYLPSRTRYEMAAERAATALSINYLTHDRDAVPAVMLCSTIRATVAIIMCC